MITTHRYAVGESINFTNEDRTRTAASGQYRIIAWRPVTNGNPWYVIKSDQESHERVVAESDLQ